MKKELSFEIAKLQLKTDAGVARLAYHYLSGRSLKEMSKTDYGYDSHAYLYTRLRKFCLRIVGCDVPRMKNKAVVKLALRRFFEAEGT